MHLSSFALLTILASAVNAFPNAPVSRANALMTTVNLYNGVDITTVAVAHSDVTTEMLPGGGKNMCAGSAFCTNDQEFRDMCADAVHKVEDVVYEVGGKGAGGVCSGKCGFFLEGRGCRATAEEFMEAKETIRHVNNCLSCGYAFKPRTGQRCWIKFDYVSKCR